MKKLIRSGDVLFTDNGEMKTINQCVDILVIGVGRDNGHTN